MSNFLEGVSAPRSLQCARSVLRLGWPIDRVAAQGGMFLVSLRYEDYDFAGWEDC